MQAQSVSVAEVLAGQKQYVIPVFQRMYEWKVDRWQALWDDLNAISEENDRDLTHFIGPMVVMANAVPYDVPRFLVVDGQQRLMTLLVLLAALRDRAEALGFDRIAKAISASTILSFMNTKGATVPKVMPRLRDRDILFSIIDGKSVPTDSDLILSQAYHYFSRELVQLAPPRPGLFSEPSDEVLDRLYNAAIQRLRVVMITLDKSDDPGNIYESLNFKHETLRDAALIRNYVFMKLGSLEEQEKFDLAYWRSFEELFNISQDAEELLTDFYYRYLISKKEYMARKRLYTAFTKYADDFLQSHSAVEFASELTRFARYFIAIKHRCPDEELETALKRFRMLETDTAIPLVLSLYDRWASSDATNRISKPTFLRMLRTVESFVLRRLILRERTRGYGLDFAMACSRSKSDNDLMRFFDERGWPTDNQVREAIRSFEFYQRVPVQCRLILTEIERSFGHKERVDLDDKGVQIEHVMPQNLTQSWREMLGENAEDVHDRLLHTFGNLTLTGYNVELGDKPFAEKQVEFAKSNISMNSYFVRLNRWAEKEILDRTDFLCSRLVDLWARPENLGPGASSASEASRRSQRGRTSSAQTLPLNTTEYDPR